MSINGLSISEAEAVLTCFGAYNESKSNLDNDVLVGLKSLLSRMSKEDIHTLKSDCYYEYLLEKIGL